MKKIYCLSLFLLMLQMADAQYCKPDSTYRDSSAGVYPKPIIPGGAGKGIDKKACINKPYEFVFTVAIPDTLTIPGIPFLINLNFAKIDTVGAISNLPKGIGYACNPPSCVFPKKTIGCLVLRGTPTNDNKPGLFKPVIKLTIGSLFGNLEIEYPGVQFPGEYILELLDENCLIATRDINIVNDNFFPNPTEGWINSREEQISDLRLTDQLGRLIAFQKAPQDSKFILPEELKDGFYLLSWKSGTRNYIQKILLQRN